MTLELLGALFITAAVFGSAVVYVMNRIEHGVHYSRSRPIHRFLAWWAENIHRSGDRMHRGLAIVLASCVVGWFVAVNGVPSNVLGFVRAASCVVLLTYSPFWMASAIGQQWINRGAHAVGEEPMFAPARWKMPLGLVSFVLGLGLLLG